MAGDADRANLSIHAANLLRDRYARVVEKVGRKGRPRARFLAERRAHTAAALVPTLAAIAAMTGATAAVTLLTEPAERRTAAIAQASVAIVVGAAALAVPAVRKNTVALVSLAVGALVAAELGWGLVARLSGGAARPWLLVLPTVVVAGIGLVHLPPRVALGLGVAGDLSLLLADPLSPPWAHM